MGDDVLATQGARASATTICTTLNQINLFVSLHIKKLSGDGGGGDIKCHYSVSGHYLKKKKKMSQFTSNLVYILWCQFSEIIQFWATLD